MGALLLTVSLPFYAALSRTPEGVFFGEDVFVVSQATVAFPLNDTLVTDLRAQAWAEAVSPEVFAFLTWRGEAVVVRGVDPDPFFALERGALPPTVLPQEAPFLWAGDRLADRFGLAPGDVVLLPSTFRPALMEASVDAVLTLEGPVADELVMDLDRARALADRGAGYLTLLRVETADPDALLAHLADVGAEVVVGGEGRTVRVEDGLLRDDRLGSLVLTRPELARELGREYISAFVQHGGNSLRVVVLGLEGLTASLLGVLLGASLSRHWLERRREVGLVRALGGGGTALLALFGRRVLTGGLVAGGIGLAAGVAVGRLLEAMRTYSLFGHVLRFPLDLATLAAVYGLYVAALLAALLLSLLFLLRQPVRELLHEASGGRPEEVVG